MTAEWTALIRNFAVAGATCINTTSPTFHTKPLFSLENLSLQNITGLTFEEKTRQKNSASQKKRTRKGKYLTANEGFYMDAVINNFNSENARNVVNSFYVDKHSNRIDLVGNLCDATGTLANLCGEKRYLTEIKRLQVGENEIRLSIYQLENFVMSGLMRHVSPSTRVYVNGFSCTYSDLNYYLKIYASRIKDIFIKVSVKHDIKPSFDWGKLQGNTGGELPKL